MREQTPGDLERKLRQARAEVVSNTNWSRTGQIMDELIRADRKLGFLQPGKQTVLVERNHEYLTEILAKMLPEMCPRHLVSYQEHHLPHYVVRDGKVEVYKNLDQDSPIVEIYARVKHPDSAAEKIPRKAVIFGRVSESNDKHKLMIGDIIGLAVVVKETEDVDAVGKQLLQMPFFRLEHYERLRKANGYNSDHYMLVYENGNPQMRGLEIEVQVTDLKSHLNSIHRPEQGHDTAYGKEKLESEHRLDGQLIVVGNSVTVPKGVCEVRRSGNLLVAEIPHLFKPYTLAVPLQD
ncbi:RelA/SpoT domain-containing protein [Candidatus Woesearchaeota archaeon]|nr:RelA/SpoT domain-containing protein [Candidatus Woesearchaeota archaeon]